MAVDSYGLGVGAKMPEQIGQYYVLQEGAGRLGGLSTVRRGFDIRDGSSVAVKFVTGPTDELSRKVFDREVKVLRTLTHPNIVGFREAGINESGTYYVVLDWVDQNLRDVLDQGPWESWDSLYKQLAKPLLDALAHAHLKQIEHRDLKPQNVLMSENGSPLLADFGIAKIRGEEQNSELTVAGFRSGPYAPPEHESPMAYVRDVYSMGVLLIQCLSAEKIRDFPDVARGLEGIDVPPDVRKLLEACINPDAQERPRNASDLAASLASLHRARVSKIHQERNPVWLRLTNAAVDHLVGSNSDRATAGAKLQADLTGQVFASFHYDKESGEYARSVVMLLGNEFRYTLKIDEDGTGCVVSAATQLEFESLEGLRRRSFALPPAFTWTLREPLSRRLAATGMSALLGVIDAHLESSRESGVVGGKHEGDELFDIWMRILDAREDLARGELDPLLYSSRETDGKRAKFKLSTPCETDLIGTEWQVQEPRSGRKFGWGEVVDQDGETLTLFGERLRNLPASASLYPHIGPSEISIARQREAVSAVKAGTTPRADFRNILLDPSKNAAPNLRPITDWGMDLDASKREAVELALGSTDVLLVQGPPGTGKTSFIAETVAQHLLENPRARVLIASQTHVAVDNALERLDRQGLAGLVRLAGLDESRVNPAVRHLLLDAQTKRWAQAVRTRAEASVEEQARTLGIPADHLQAALTLQQLASVCQELEAIERHVNDVASQVSVPSELSTALDAAVPSADLQDRIDSLTDFRIELASKIQSILAGDLTIHSGIGAGEARSAIDVLLGASSDAKALLRRLEVQAEWLQRIASDRSLAAVYLETTNVVAGTCTGFLRNPAVKLLDFDLCIVDEASKATLTEALVPMSRANKWILVGDTHQLPPTDEDLLRSGDILREHEVSEADVTQTLFQRMVDLLPEHSQRMLKEQYRMIRPIGDLISTCFYDGQLKSPRTDGLPGYEQVFGSPVTWLDTGPLGERRRESAPGGAETSYANRAEAGLIVSQLETLQRAIDFGLIRPETNGERVEVLVVAPYRSQVDEITRRLARTTFSKLDVTVMSVDAVQGREADVVLLSLTRSNTEGKLGFLGPDYWRRINVALSRARFGLTIVGDAGFIRGTNGALRTVLDYMTNHRDDCQIRGCQQ